MTSNKPFEIIQEINKDELIKLFADHEAKRPVAKDQFAHDRIEGLKKTINTKFYRIKFNPSIVSHLMLPHHGHEINIIPPYGKNIADSLALFAQKEIENPNSDCIQKIKNLKSYFYSNNQIEWTGEFILIGNNIGLAHPGDHYSSSSQEKYFIFNGFHRLMAYFLQINETGFKPLLAYYADGSN